MLPTDASAFPPTRHSLVARLGDASDGERRAAFDDLVRAYRPAMLGYLTRRWHLARADADDATQLLLLHLWEQGTLAGFDPARARFRTFLRTCIDRHASNRLRNARALRRGGGAEHLSLDDVAAADALEAQAALVAAADAEDGEACFRDEVARALLARAIARLRRASTGCVSPTRRRWTPNCSAGSGRRMTRQGDHHPRCAAAPSRSSRLLHDRGVPHPNAPHTPFTSCCRVLRVSTIDAHPSR